MTTPILRTIAILVVIVPIFGCFIVETIWSWLICTELIAVIAHPTVIARSTLFLTIDSAIWIFGCDTVHARAYGFRNTLFTDETRTARLTLLFASTRATCDGDAISAHTRERRGNALSTSQGAAMASIGTVR